MDELVEVRLIAEKYLATELLDDGMAEVVMRRADAKFREFVKCKISSDGVQGDSKLSEILNHMISNQSETNKRLNKMRGVVQDLVDSMNSSRMEYNNLNESAKNLSIQIDSLFNNSSVVRKISYLNTGLSLANMAVDLSGFIIIGQKLSDLSENVKTLEDGIHNTENLLIDDLITDTQELSREYTRVMNRIKDKRAVDDDELERLLAKFEKNIARMINGIDKGHVPSEKGYECIYTLLPGYTSLIIEWLNIYYSVMNKVPDNYINFTSLFDRLLTHDFRVTLQDYYLLDKRCSYTDTMDIICAQTLLVVNAITQIQDHLKLLQTMRHEEVDQGIDEWNCKRYESIVQNDEVFISSKNRNMKTRKPESEETKTEVVQSVVV